MLTVFINIFKEVNDWSKRGNANFVHLWLRAIFVILCFSTYSGEIIVVYTSCAPIANLRYVMPQGAYFHTHNSKKLVNWFKSPYNSKNVYKNKYELFYYDLI